LLVVLVTAAACVVAVWAIFLRSSGEESPSSTGTAGERPAAGDAGPAEAQPSDRAAEGQRQFALGNFEEALREYRAAFEAEPQPGLLLHIGACHRELGDLDSARSSYTQYLEQVPDAPDRDAIRALIAELAPQVDAGAAPASTPEVAAGSEPAPPPKAKPQKPKKRTGPAKKPRRGGKGDKRPTGKRPKPRDLVDRTW
jgi:tetratricopeptide (TPR) repeat protein